MPTPTALDRIAAGVHDIATALKNPTEGSPLSPLDSSQVAALNDLLALLTAKLPGPEHQETTTADNGATDHNHQAVDAAPNDTSCITAGNTPPNIPTDAPRLRVENDEAQGASNSDITYRTATKRKSRKKQTQ